MRVLLDEHLDHRLKPWFDSDLEVATVHERGWGGKKNGELLELAQPEFDVLVTMDRGIEHQQNVTNLPSSSLFWGLEVRVRAKITSDIYAHFYPVVLP